MASKLCCPECGRAAVVERINRHSWRVYCEYEYDGCQASAQGIEATAATREGAHDDFVAECEVKGMTTALAETLRQLVHRGAPA